MKSFLIILCTYISLPVFSQVVISKYTTPLELENGIFGKSPELTEVIISTVELEQKTIFSNTKKGFIKTAEPLQTDINLLTKMDIFK